MIQCVENTAIRIDWLARRMCMHSIKYMCVQTWAMSNIWMNPALKRARMCVCECVFVRLLDALLFRFVEIHFLFISNSNQLLLLDCVHRNDIDEWGWWHKINVDTTNLFDLSIYDLETVLMHTINHAPAHTHYLSKKVCLFIHHRGQKHRNAMVNEWMIESNESSEFYFWN